ncbi:MAG TPA: DUF5916 domain-containing protein [Candidatus Acidoferrales bacterium]|nr:DUF5916 domain-containing protein [Candidatus Acidoferrales bacterium]
MIPVPIFVRAARVALLVLFVAPLLAYGITTEKVPKLAHAVRIEDFESMEPTGVGLEMSKVSGFIQNAPSDGKPGTQQTEAYLGYDDSNLYIVFLCFDEPHLIRSSLSRREPSTPFDIDDYVEITLDTFHDQRHAFIFDVNPAGVQADGLRTEGQGTDYSWDTLWYSKGKITNKGYIIWVAIPFRSIRFVPQGDNEWGITLMRYIAREGESDWWPRVSSKIFGRLNQAAAIHGIEGVSPGHNMQFTPYVESRSFHELDTNDPVSPRYSDATERGKVGLDSKFVLHNTFVLDATINPDFAQVESDDPQNTANTRFEVYFPEKRPFFLENSNFFEAPLISVNTQTRMLFTRRIADPKYGIRLTGKQGPWNVGVLEANDCSPGDGLPSGDPLKGKCANFTVARVTHDINKQSSVGAMFTDREFMGTYNRVGGLDGAFRINPNWNSTYRGYVSSTFDGSTYSFGQHHEGVIYGSGRRFTFTVQYLDITPNFRAEAGFVPRVDQRAIYEYGHFYFRPEGKVLVAHGPEQNITQLWDHKGNTLLQGGSFDYAFMFRKNITVAPIVMYESDTLRPSDFSGLPALAQYAQDGVGLVFRGSPNRIFSWNTQIVRDGTVVVVPAPGQMPYTGDETSIYATASVKPINRLQLEHTYILERVVNGKAGHAVFNNHIIRTKANYQFTRELSLRAITQYNGLLANPAYSSYATTKNLNFDILLTYLLHPGTAVYLGYNSNMENVDPSLCVRIAGTCDPNGAGLLRTRNSFANDGRLIFVKMSYLFRR